MFLKSKTADCQGFQAGGCSFQAGEKGQGQRGMGPFGGFFAYGYWQLDSLVVTDFFKRVNEF